MTASLLPQLLRCLAAQTPLEQAWQLTVIGTDGGIANATTGRTDEGRPGPAAVVVLADGGDVHAEVWAHLRPPILVVLPPRADTLAVLAAFSAGADACVCSACIEEITAHLAALLRRAAPGTARAV